MREALTELIEAKYGALESRYKKRIAEASGDQLKSWLKRILTAATAPDLFQS